MPTLTRMNTFHKKGIPSLILKTVRYTRVIAFLTGSAYSVRGDLLFLIIGWLLYEGHRKNVVVSVVRCFFNSVPTKKGLFKKF